MDDLISRQSIKKKLKEHHDFFIKAYGGFNNLPLNDKSRVDEISSCIAMVVNEPSVQPEIKVLEKIRSEIFELWQNEPCTIEHGCLNEILEIIDKYRAESEE